MWYRQDTAWDDACGTGRTRDGASGTGRTINGHEVHTYRQNSGTVHVEQAEHWDNERGTGKKLDAGGTADRNRVAPLYCTSA